MRAVDTNVLIRLIVQDDSRQTDAAKDFTRDGIWISTPALAEATWALAAIYGRSPENIGRAVAMMLDMPNAVVQDSEAVAEALNLFQARPSLGFSDCLMLALARKAGTCLWARSAGGWRRSRVLNGSAGEEHR